MFIFLIVVFFKMNSLVLSLVKNQESEYKTKIQYKKKASGLLLGRIIDLWWPLNWGNGILTSVPGIEIHAPSM